MTHLLTIEQAREILGISRTKMYELLHSEDFPSLKIGRNWRIVSELLDQWINDQIMYSK